MTYKYRSADGLAQSNDRGTIATWDRIGADMAREQREWVAALRADGVKAAHPDDGWVRRWEDSVQFVYPQFNDIPQVGDPIALGWPRKHRIVTVTRIETVRGLVIDDYLRYFFPADGGTPQ